MDAQYPSPIGPIPPLGAFYPNGHPPIMPPPPPELLQPRLYHLQTYSVESIAGYSDMDDPNRTLISPQQGSQRSRRRQAPGADHVKHRRTRSGCYTCRQRRVKCDETRPICERCRKGKRECAYPGSSSSAKAARKEGKSRTASGESGSSPSGDEVDEDALDKKRLSVIPDTDETTTEMDEDEPQSARSDGRNVSDASTWAQDSKTPPSTDSSMILQPQSRPTASRTTLRHSVKPSISENSRWLMLPRDVRMYLKYHKDHLSHHHYAFKYDSGNFLKSTFLEIAMNDQSQALLYAVVAFAAYHHSLAQEEFKISTFLSYYNESIMLLQKSLKNKKPGVSTLLTMLQLATIEEFLGDWGHLLHHQKAAHKVLLDLFTPQTIMQDETRRRIIAWYIRFDLFAGMMSGSETQLSRDWFAACKEHYSKQARDRPDDLGTKYEQFFSTSRLLATDVALVFAERRRNAITNAQFAATAGEMLAQFTKLGQSIDTAFTDPTSFVKDFSRAPPPSEDDITDYRDPNFLYAGDLYTMNFILIDFWAIELMFKANLAKAQNQEPSEELIQLALKMCKMFEAIEHYDCGPPGAIIGCQASLGIASLFLKDQQHVNWCRRKYALVEQKGYIYPPSLRQHMSDIWGVDVTYWWLPDEEGLPDTIRAVRDFIDYRTVMPKDTMDAHVRDMSGIFKSMDIDERRGSLGTTDSDQFSPLVDDSSPEQTWPG